MPTPALPPKRCLYDISPSVVYQLGETLISDEIQAVVELVKNCYDADASYANIIVETNEPPGELSRCFPQANGYIVVEDDGVGMAWDEIRKGWLTFSVSMKRTMRDSGKLTTKGRTPLGEKGLGRISSQKLGRYLELWTVKEQSRHEYYVGTDWGLFTGKSIKKVPAFIEDNQNADRIGTRLLISDLRSSSVWEGKRQQVLVQKLSELIFPFSHLRPFDVQLTINGKSVELGRVSESVLSVATARVRFDFDGKALHVAGDYRPHFLLPSSKGDDERRVYEDLIAADKGADYFAFLSERSPKTEIQWNPHPSWLLSFAQSYGLDSLGEIGVITGQRTTRSAKSTEAVRLANPGPFTGELYTFPRRGTELGETSPVFTKLATASRIIDQFYGVRVFRDGFGVRPFGLKGNDWLGLAESATSAGSSYGLRSKNTIGYVALSASANRQLEETTDREGFVENEYAATFYLLMRRVVKTVNDVNEDLRRAYNDYRKAKAEAALDLASPESAELFTRMRTTASDSIALAKSVAGTQVRIRDAARELAPAIDELSHSAASDPDEVRRAAQLVRRVDLIFVDAEGVLNQVQSMLKQTAALAQIADVLQPDLRRLRGDLERFSELAGLGLTAEALSHELSNIVDSLSARTTAFSRHLKSERPIDPVTVAFVEELRSILKQILAQISHLDPSMTYVREKLDSIAMGQFFEEVREFYSRRWARSGITMVLDRPSRDFDVVMNKGKLIQVVDNLVLNSEYWLKEALTRGSIRAAEIHVRCTKPFVEIYDTGLGVAPEVQHSLFQPFVTCKPNGRGLGLFITRQLLDSSGCNISLSPDKNWAGRRYIFRIDFTGALDAANSR